MNTDIEDLQEQIADLKADLEYDRRQHRAEALALAVKTLDGTGSEISAVLALAKLYNAYIWKGDENADV